MSFFEISMSLLEFFVKFRQLVVELLDLGGRFCLLLAKAALEVGLDRGGASLVLFELTSRYLVVRAMLLGLSSEIVNLGLTFRRLEFFASLLVSSELLLRYRSVKVRGHWDQSIDDSPPSSASTSSQFP